MSQSSTSKILKYSIISNVLKKSYADWHFAKIHAQYEFDKSLNYITSNSDFKNDIQYKKFIDKKFKEANNHNKKILSEVDKFSSSLKNKKEKDLFDSLAYFYSELINKMWDKEETQFIIDSNNIDFSKHKINQEEFNEILNQEIA